MAAIDYKQNAVNSFEPIRDAIYNLEQSLFEATMKAEDFRESLQSATTGKELFEKYKPYVEGWLKFMNDMNALDKETKLYGKPIDAYLKKLDGK